MAELLKEPSQQIRFALNLHSWMAQIGTGDLRLQFVLKLSLKFFQKPSKFFSSHSGNIFKFTFLLGGS